MSVRDYYSENKVLMVSMGCSGVTNWIQPFQKYIFPIYPLYLDEAFALTRYFHEKMNLTKIAMFYQNDDYGKQGVEGVERYIKAKGLQLVATVSAEVTDRDLSSHALKLRDSGAQAVIMWAMPTHGALLLGECCENRVQTPMGDQQHALRRSGDDASLQRSLGRNDHSNFGELPDSNHPLMVKYRAWHQKYEPKERWSTFYTAGISFAEPFVEGLRRAGKNLNPETFVKAMETLKDWQGVGPPDHVHPNGSSGRQTCLLSVRFSRTGVSRG